MRGIRRQLQHGPTFRSTILLAIGICVIFFQVLPQYIPSLTSSDDLRHILPRVSQRVQQRNDQMRLQREKEELLVRQAEQELGTVDASVADAQAAADDLATREANAELANKVAMSEAGKKELAIKTSARGIHVIVTSNGSPYMNWQTRIMYHSFRKVAQAPGSDMKFFTRVLHRSKEDPLMEDIPTVRVDPLDPSCDNWCEYPVASRPDAINQWLNSGDPKGDWVLMIETDYVFVKPISIPSSGRALGFPFSYIAPGNPDLASVLRRFYQEGPLTDIPSTGNAPILAPTAELRKVIPIWVDITAKVEADAEAKSRLGWVREMYAFSIATALAKMPVDLPPAPEAIMCQPPEDSKLHAASIVHYTWGNQLKDKDGKVVWEFDKRKFTDRGLPGRIPDPPLMATEALRLLIVLINDAIMALPKYTEGELHELGKSPEEVKQIMEEQRLQLQEAHRAEAVEKQPDDKAADKDQDGAQLARGSIHVMATSNGSPYMNWQTQIMYHTYQKVAAQPHSDMRYFTRVLHRLTNDNLSRHIHTVRVDPLDPKCDVWCDYPVASRPDAINQWLSSGDVKGDWILMIETDYLFVKPISIPASGRALGFPFGYIIPTYPTIHDIMIRFYPGDLKDVPQTGNAPVLATTKDLRRLVPIWVDITARIEKDPEAKEKLGWVREMYAFSIAAALAKMPIDLPLVPQAIMVQPPADAQLGDAAIIHYTWASEMKNEKNIVVWSWDKRNWTTEGSFPPHLQDPPPGLASELQLLMIRTLNDAIDSINPSKHISS